MSLSERLDDLAPGLLEQTERLRETLRADQAAFRERWGWWQEWDSVRRDFIKNGGAVDSYQEAEARYAAAQGDYNKEVAARLDEVGRQSREIAALNRRFNLAIIGDVIIRIGALRREKTETGDPITVWYWPFEGQAPDPRQADQWAAWPDRVLDWMAGAALRQVREQLQNPNSGGR